MRREFNTEGQCESDFHYMVKLDERIKNIKEQYIDKRKYIVMNKGRQYGKTTTLMALVEYLKNDYVVLLMDFQEIGTAEYKDEAAFTNAFAQIFIETFAQIKVEKKEELLQEVTAFAENPENGTLRKLFICLSAVCAKSPKPLVLLIDEADSAANNQVFIDFLSLLRKYYLNRRQKATFYSVILAGVYDIKNLKLKMRQEEDEQYNSPWNIAAKFKIEMNFSADQIAQMLQEYEKDNQTNMDINTSAKEIYEYTSGYPYLVSAICKIIDEELSDIGSFSNKSDAWTREGIAAAVNILLKENIPLFDSMIKQLHTFPDLRNIIEEILYQGKIIPFSADVKSVNIGMMFAFLKEENGRVAISNRIFEMRLLNMFITEDAIHSEAFRCGERDRTYFIQNEKLNMDLVLEKFVEHYTDIYGNNNEKFIEDYGRKLFLLYLKPIINGTGNYYLEAQTRDARRTDVIVDYRGEQFIIELKIWHGNEYNERGEAQLAGYLDYFHRKKGYLISFNFNKKKNIGVKTITFDDKTIVEAVI